MDPAAALLENAGGLSLFISVATGLLFALNYYFRLNSRNIWRDCQHIVLRTLAIIGSSLILGAMIIVAFVQNYGPRFMHFITRPSLYAYTIRRKVGQLLTSHGPSSHLHDSVADYCRAYGYHCQVYAVKTGDCHVLPVERITSPHIVAHTPILIQHGLFQCSGIFVANEEKSLAFKLVDEGYEVWLGNNRGVPFEYDELTDLTPLIPFEHAPIKSHIPQSNTSASIHDSIPKQWNWSLDELAFYDFPALIECVLSYTNTSASKVVFMGHSQGSAQAFACLSVHPTLNDKIKAFVALSPAAHVVPPSNPALRCMLGLNAHRMYQCFGMDAFIPIMSRVQALLPASLFSLMAYNMFSHLFGWSDTNWLKSRKRRYFQFTPRPMSSKLMLHWSQMLRKWQNFSIFSHL